MSKYISEANFQDICDYYFSPDNILFGTKPKILTNDIINTLKDNTIIYLCLNNLKQFVRSILPIINIKFILLSGISDFIVPYLKEPERYLEVENLLNSDKLIHWFGLNVYIPHPKISVIPIGIPRSLPFIIYAEECQFMAWQNDDFAKDMVLSTLERLNNNRNILSIMKLKKDTPKLIYINYTTINSKDSSIGKNINFRQKLDQYLINNSSLKIKKENQLCEWFRHLEIVQEYKFVLEPFGRCMDGYRVWESLIVGTIPVVFDSPIRELYEDLPVLIINSFEQLNEDYLNEQYEKIISRDDYKFEKLEMKYWSDLILKYKN